MVKAKRLRLIIGAPLFHLMSGFTMNSPSEQLWLLFSSTV